MKNEISQESRPIKNFVTNQGAALITQLAEFPSIFCPNQAGEPPELQMIPVLLKS